MSEVPPRRNLNHRLTLKVFAADKAGVDVEVAHCHRAELLKVKVQNVSAENRRSVTAGPTKNNVHNSPGSPVDGVEVGAVVAHAGVGLVGLDGIELVVVVAVVRLCRGLGLGLGLGRGWARGAGRRGGGCLWRG